MEYILKRLFEMKEDEYASFQRKIISNIDPEKIIGVRTDKLRALAVEIENAGMAEEFLSELPHRYFEEDQLHSFIASREKSFEKAIGYSDRFLPYIDNWATCDQFSPKVFSKHKKELIVHIERWIISKDTYTIRFAIEMLMSHYLDSDFDEKYHEYVINIESDEYYVNMMRAWYFATSLSKQYDKTVKIIEDKRLDVWTHNKTIQKAIESNRISVSEKEYLKTLKIKGAVKKVPQEKFPES